MYCGNIWDISFTKERSYEELCDIIDAYHAEYRFYTRLLHIFCKNYRKLNKEPEKTIIYHKIKENLSQLERNSDFFIWELKEKIKELPQ